jgi:UDP-N-acetyl-D-galactosamine dehydrogenase
MSDPWADAAEFAHEYDLLLGAVDARHPVDALVVAVGHQQYRGMSPTALRKLCQGEKPVLADIKCLYNRHEAAEAGFTVFRL